MIALWMGAAWGGPTSDLELPTAFAEHAPEGTVRDGPWWEDLGDPLLLPIVREALQANLDVKAMQGRLMQAEGGQLQAAAPLAPTAAFNVSTNSNVLANSAFPFCSVSPIDFLAPPLAADLCWQGSAMFQFGWQLDVFGRQSTQLLAARYELLASQGDQRSTALMVSGATVEAYLDVVSAQQQTALLTTQLESQQNLLEVLELRFGEGGARGLDVLQQRQVVAGTMAALPNARIALQTRSRGLAVLMGRTPSAIPTLAEALPEPTVTPAVGTPEALLERRPDLHAAKSRARAARSRHTSATLALAPSVRLGANAGWNFAYADEFDTVDNWGLNGTLTVPLFNGGMAHGAIRTAHGASIAADATLDSAILGAVRDVENALVMEREQALRHDASRAQAQAARLAYTEARERYLQGIDTFLNVLAAQGALQSAELLLVQAHRDRLSARVQLWTALGASTDASDPSGVSP